MRKDIKTLGKAIIDSICVLTCAFCGVSVTLVTSFCMTRSLVFLYKRLIPDGTGISNTDLSNLSQCAWIAGLIICYFSIFSTIQVCGDLYVYLSHKADGHHCHYIFSTASLGILILLFSSGACPYWEQYICFLP